MNVILGPSHQFIQMGQSGVNVEQSQNDFTLEELHLFLANRLNSLNVIFKWIISLFYTLTLYLHDNSSLHSGVG